MIRKLAIESMHAPDQGLHERNRPHSAHAMQGVAEARPSRVGKKSQRLAGDAGRTGILTGEIEDRRKVSVDAQANFRVASVQTEAATASRRGAG